jgi:Rha family phage regulatory protein
MNHINTVHSKSNTLTENLDLIQIKHNQPMTTSVIVAEKFTKRHDFVIRKIENLIQDDEEDRLIFAEMSYQDSYGRNQKQYIMDRRSFSILCMSFTGKKALKWKNRFFDAFEAMERFVWQKQSSSWQQARIESKDIRLELTDSIKRLVDLANESGSKNAHRYYEIITKMIYQEVFSIKKVPPHFRDTLDKKALHHLQLVEWKMAEWLSESIDACEDYHEPYREIKARLKSLIDVIGQINQALLPNFNHQLQIGGTTIYASGH